MSEDMDLPPEVYRRRRIIAAVAAIIILILLIVGITWAVNTIQNRNTNEAVPSATATAEAFQNFSARADVTASPTSSASANPSQAADPSKSPDPSASTTSAAVAACSAQNLKVTVAPSKKQYAAGEAPSFTVTYTNISKTPCAIGGDKAENGIELNITSGAAQTYSKNKCAPAPLKKAELEPGKEATGEIAWDRKSNASGCEKTKDAEKGTYSVVASVNGIASQAVNFTLA